MDLPYRFEPVTLVEPSTNGSNEVFRVGTADNPFASAMYVFNAGTLTWDPWAGGGGGGGGGDASAANQLTEILRLEAIRDRLPAAFDAGRLAVNVGNFPATQPVSGPLTDAQLRALAVAVSGPLTDAQLRAAAVPVSGPLTDAQLRAAAVVISHANLPNLDVLLSTRLKPADTLAAVTSLTQMNGQAIQMGTGVRTAGTQRVTVATDDLVPTDVNDRAARLLGKIQERENGYANISLYAEAVAGIIAETAISMNKSTNYAAAAAATSNGPTAGKEWVICGAIVSWVSTSTTANTARLRLRVNPGGAAIITSPIACTFRIGWESATFIANEIEVQPFTFAKPIVIPNGGQMMATIACVAANGTLDVQLFGYERTP